MTDFQEFTFLSSDGHTQLHGAQWTPADREPIAVLQIAHGVAEHILRYDDFARYLNDRGILVAGHDHLGHGRTARNPLEFGWFADRDGWKHVVKDVRALRERVGAEYPGLPCFLLGHSMGSFVVRGYLMFWPGTVDGAILSGTGQVLEKLISAGPDDVVIAFSYPRYSTSTVTGASFCHSKGAKIVAMTDSRTSPLGQTSDFVLQTKSDMASLVDSLVAPLSVINALVVALCLKCPEQVRKNLETLEETWNNYQVYLNDEIDFIDDEPMLDYSLRRREK